MHKFRHLIKPFVVCSSHGLIVDVFGPYSVKRIYNRTVYIKKRDDFQDSMLQENTIILGFRD
jgi:hypothetical protein